MICVVVPVCRAVHVHVWVLEEAELEFRAQYSRDSRVDHRISDEAALERREVGTVLLERRLEYDVEPRLERVLRRTRGTRFGKVQHRGATSRGRIGNDEPRKAPLLLEHVR